MTVGVRISSWLGLFALLALAYRSAVEPAIQVVPALRPLLAPAGVTALPIGTVLFIAALLLVPKPQRERAWYKWTKRLGWLLVALAWGALVLLGVYVSMHK